MGGFIDLVLIMGIAFALCGVFYNGCLLYLQMREWLADKFR